MQEHDQSSCPDVVHTPREADEKDGGHMVDNLLVKVLREEGPYTHTHIHTHTHTQTHTHKHTHTQIIIPSIKTTVSLNLKASRLQLAIEPLSTLPGLLQNHLYLPSQ